MDRRAALAGIAALGLAALIVVLVMFGRPGGGGSAARIVEIGVNEVLSVDPRGGDRLRLSGLATDAQGRAALILQPEGRDGAAAFELTAGASLVRGHRRLTLESVRSDPRRGDAIQFQWVPRDSAAARPIFPVGEEPVPLTLTDTPLEVAIAGPVPPPGPAAEATVRITGGGLAPIQGRIRPGGSLAVPELGELRWLGTRERLLARIRIEPAGRR